MYRPQPGSATAGSAGYRPVLPAVSSSASASASASVTPNAESHNFPSRIPPTKRTRAARVAVACNSCRAKKSVCSGDRPMCKQCRQRSSECQYLSQDESESHTMLLKRQVEVLSLRNADLERILDQVVHLPETEALQFVSMLRRAPTQSAMLPSLIGDVQPQPQPQPQPQLGADRPSDETADCAVLPSSSMQPGLDLKLLMCYPMAFPLVDPSSNPAWTELFRLDAQQETSAAEFAIGIDTDTSVVRTTPAEPTTDSEQRYTSPLLESLNIDDWDFCAPP